MFQQPEPTQTRYAEETRRADASTNLTVSYKPYPPNTTSMAARRHNIINLYERDCAACFYVHMLPRRPHKAGQTNCGHRARRGYTDNLGLGVVKAPKNFH